MGHAHLGNISEFVIRYLYAKGQVSIDDILNQMHRKGETLHASEDEYDDYGTMGSGVESVITFHRGKGVIEPADPTPEETALLDYPDKLTNSNFTQSCEGFGFPSDAELVGYGFAKEDNKLWEAFYNIKWRFCEGQRNRYKNGGTSNYDHLGSITV